MKILGIEHVAVATRSLEKGAQFWSDILGLHFRKREVVESEDVVVDIFDTGRGKVELFSGYSEQSFINKFLQKKNSGIHHLCLEVDNIEDAIKEMKEKGIRLLNEKPKKGAEGYSIIFIHPESTGGVLVELCQKVK